MQNWHMQAFVFLHFGRNETWIVGVEVSSLALGVYCGQLGATKNWSKSLYFPLCFRVNTNIWERAFSACCVHACLHMKASGEAHLSTRQHIKAFSHWSERPPALELLYLSPVCLETTKRLHLCGCVRASEFIIWKHNGKVSIYLSIYLTIYFPTYLYLPT